MMKAVRKVAREKAGAKAVGKAVKKNKNSPIKVKGSSQVNGRVMVRNETRPVIEDLSLLVHPSLPWVVAYYW